MCTPFKRRGWEGRKEWKKGSSPDKRSDHDGEEELDGLKSHEHHAGAAEPEEFLLGLQRRHTEEREKNKKNKKTAGNQVMLQNILKANIWLGLLLVMLLCSWVSPANHSSRSFRPGRKNDNWFVGGNEPNDSRPVPSSRESSGKLPGIMHRNILGSTPSAVR